MARSAAQQAVYDSVNSGKPAAPSLTPDQQSLANNQNIPAGQAGSPWSLAIKPSNSPVVTSDNARAGYQSILDSITKLSATAPAVPIAYGGQTYNDTSALVGAQRQSLEARKTAEISRIEAEFNQAKDAQAQAQKGETGTQSMGLARIGGFDSASGQAVLTNLQRVHETEQQTLLTHRQASIQQANQAYEDKDFALAQLQLDEARKTEQMIYDRQKDFVSLSLQVKGEERSDLTQKLQQSQFDYQKQQDIVKYNQDNGIISKFYQKPGSSVVYDADTHNALTYEQYKALGGVGGPGQKWSDVQVIIPKKEYAAGSIGEYQFYAEQEVAAGRAPVSYNAYQDMDVNRKKAIARAGASTSVSYGDMTRAAQVDAVSRYSKKLSEQVGADGYVRPDVWKSGYRAWVSEGFSGSDYSTALQGFINPADPQDYGLK